MIQFTRDQNFIALFYIIFAIFISATAFGINMVVFPAVLLQHNVDPFLIGIAQSTEICANIFISFYLSRIVGKSSSMKALAIFAIIYAINILLISFYKNFALWLLFCAANGMCWIGTVIIRQSWIAHLSKNENRSIIIALTTCVFCTGFALGSILVKNTGAHNYNSFLLSSGLIVLSILMILPASKTQPKEIDSQRIGLKKFFKHNPNVAVARFLVELQCGCLIYLSIVFGNRINLSTENSGLLISAFMASGFCDLYAGFLVKKYDRNLMIKIGFAGCLATILVAFVFYKIFAVLLASYFIYGCFVALTYTSVLTIVNESFAKEKLVAANATFQSIASIGQLVGSLVGGASIALFGFIGFFMTIILSGLVYFIFLFSYEKNRAKI